MKPFYVKLTMVLWTYSPRYSFALCKSCIKVSLASCCIFHFLSYLMWVLVDDILQPWSGPFCSVVSDLCGELGLCCLLFGDSHGRDELVLLILEAINSSIQHLILRLATSGSHFPNSLALMVGTLKKRVVNSHAHVNFQCYIKKFITLLISILLYYSEVFLLSYYLQSHLKFTEVPGCKTTKQNDFQGVKIPLKPGRCIKITFFITLFSFLESSMALLLWAITFYFCLS